MRKSVLTLFAAGVVLAIGGVAAADHLAKCPGTWKLVSAERDGKALPREDTENITLTCKADGETLKLVVKKGDKVVTEATAKLVRKGDKHDQFNVTYIKGFNQKKSLEGKTLHGIIHIEGDTMKVCWGADEGYPKDFTAAKDSGCTVRTYQRVKN